MESNSFNTSSIWVLKCLPNLSLKFIYAVSARDLKSERAVLISPEGVKIKPRYLYDRTFSNLSRAK